MYLSSAEIAQGRQHTLNNLHTASAACVAASERMAELWMRIGRNQIDNLSQESTGTGGASIQWVSGMQAQSAGLLKELLEIVGDTQQTVILAAAAQTRVLDQMLVTSLDRASRSTPAEALPAISSFRTGIEQAEQTLTGWAEAARQSVQLFETGFGQLASGLAAQADAGSRASLRDNPASGGKAAAAR